MYDYYMGLKILLDITKLCQINKNNKIVNVIVLTRKTLEGIFLHYYSTLYIYNFDCYSVLFSDDIVLPRNSDGCFDIVNSMEAYAGMMLGWTCLLCSCSCCWIMEGLLKKCSDEVMYHLINILRCGVLFLVLFMSVIPLTLTEASYVNCTDLQTRSCYTTIFLLANSIPALVLIIGLLYGCFAYLICLCSR